ncbi:hypothetical protein GCM10010987_40880 [Bradyrhizobium guangdongense]|uniref:Uncharacterized protein n=1 Tax=Bradyrhizobium guangdongense TaxID=1325090 RepID=A0AA87W794_9BRAD|nr:hypothetical protein GCM10010987_40880 [Bradyrhizobium guangdongense]
MDQMPPEEKDEQPRCPKCRAVSRLNHAMLDIKSGKLVRLYKCSKCGGHFWDD